MTTNLPDETPLESTTGESTPVPNESTAAETPENVINLSKPSQTTESIPTETVAPPSEPTKPAVTAAEQPREYWKLSFHGEGTKFFVIQLVNFILRLLTFNFYYPWAKAAKLRYLYEQTEFANSRFTFHGTGKEIFIGYIKLIGFLLLGGLIFVFMPLGLRFTLGIFLFYGLLVIIYPLALHGTVKYRFSRTSWRGIFFGYHGQLSELIGRFFLGVLFSIFTLGIYFSWLQVDLRRYVTENLRFGNVEFAFTGRGTDLFLIKLKYFAFLFLGSLAIGAVIGTGEAEEWFFLPDYAKIIYFTSRYFLIIFLFVLVTVMRQREVFQFYVDNTKIWQNGQWHEVTLDLTIVDLFILSVTNVLITIFTLGIATPFVEIRTLNFIMPRLAIEGTFDPNLLVQTESDYRDATGEDIGDWLDIDLA